MISRFLDWLFPARVARRNKALRDEEDQYMREKLLAEERREDRKRQRDLEWEAARRATLPKVKAHAPSTPPVKTAPRAPYNTTTRRAVDDGVVTSASVHDNSDLIGSMVAATRRAEAPVEESFVGKGGTFDGGGASGDWEEQKTSCSAPAPEPATSSGYDGGSCSSGDSGGSDSGGSCGGGCD